MGAETGEIERQIDAVLREMAIKIGVLREHAVGLEHLYLTVQSIHPVVVIDPGGPAGRVGR